MRTLKFIVEGQIVKPDPKCDFENLIPGNDIKLEFIFSPEWKKYNKVVEFTSRLGVEYPPQIIEYEQYCVVPEEALNKRFFKFRVFGKMGKLKLKTNKIEIDQNGGKV